MNENLPYMIIVFDDYLRYGCFEFFLGNQSRDVLQTTITMNNSYIGLINKFSWH